MTEQTPEPRGVSLALSAVLHPITDGETIPLTIQHRGQSPAITIQWVGEEGLDDFSDNIFLSLQSTGLNPDQVSFFLHEISHMVLKCADQNNTPTEG